MRSISLVEKIEFEYKGSVFQNALCFTDVDNDGDNELCVCNTAGELHVYKGIRSSKPWKVNKGMGSVVVLCGGPVRDQRENLLCSLDTEGVCHLFDVPNEKIEKDNALTGESFKPPNRATSPSRAGELRLLHHQKLAPNPKVALLADIANDGSAEFIIGYTDRFVRIYKWYQKEEESDDLIPAAPHQSPLVKQGSKDESDQKATLSFTLSVPKDGKQSSPSISKSDSSQIGNDTANISKCCSDTTTSQSSKKHLPNYRTAGQFVLMKQFSLLAQIGSLAVGRTAEGMNQLVSSQTNGGYLVLGVYDNEKGFTETTDTSIDSPTLPLSESYPTFYPIHAKSSRSNYHTTTEIIGGIRRNYEPSGALGICTQDGSYMILDNTENSNSLNINSNPVKNTSEHFWFGMSRLDFNNNGDDEVVLCSMNGMTYIVDKRRDVVSFNFNEKVAAFQAGYYGNENTSTTPCLCYVTLNGKISLYYNVWIKTMKVKCVHGALIEKIKQREDLKYILDMFKLPNGEIDHQKIQSLVKHIWSEKS